MHHNHTEDRKTKALATLRERIEEQKLEFREKMRELKTKLDDASSPLSISAVDAGGAVIGLGLKAGTEWLVDKVKKDQASAGQARPPKILSGIVATGAGVIGYAGNLAIPYGYPMTFLRDIPKSGMFALTVLGLKELSQGVGVWLEQRQIKAQAERAALTAQQAAAIPPPAPAKK